MKRALAILCLSVGSTVALCGCGNKNIDKATINLCPSIGVYHIAGSEIEKGTTIPKTFTVAKGTPLSAISFERPILPLNNEPRYAVSWTDGKNHYDDTYIINEDITLHAEYFNNITDARASAIGTIGGAVQDACARQPEAIHKIKEKEKLVDLYVSHAIYECGTFSICQIGSSQADAFARQPEVIDKLYELSTIYYDAILDFNSDIRSLGVAKAGKSAMDAAARQPEAITTVFTESAKIAVKHMKNCNYMNSYCFGKVGSSAADAIARQPEAGSKLNAVLDGMLTLLARANTYSKTFAITNICSECMDACARQPEAIDQITEVGLMQIEEILYGHEA